MAPRTLGLVLSLWLFFSAFAMPRSHASFANAWLVGLAAAIAAFAGFRSPRARFLDTTLSAWLLASAFLLTGRSGVAFWNDVVVAVLLFATSLVPGTMYLTHVESRRARA